MGSIMKRAVNQQNMIGVVSRFDWRTVRFKIIPNKAGL